MENKTEKSSDDHQEETEESSDDHQDETGAKANNATGEFDTSLSAPPVQTTVHTTAITR